MSEHKQEEFNIRKEGENFIITRKTEFDSGLKTTVIEEMNKEGFMQIFKQLDQNVISGDQQITENTKVIENLKKRLRIFRDFVVKERLDEFKEDRKKKHNEDQK